MPNFSVSLTFMWPNLSLPDAIRAAKAAGFEAVECHWPYEQEPAEINQALAETGLSMLGINTLPGESFGLAAMPGLEESARASIDQALDYADKINAPNVHVMAGKTEDPAAAATFEANLAYACYKAASLGKTILIEPLNPYDAPGYFLATTDQAADIIGRLGKPNLKLMFDCYHVQRTEGDLTGRLKELMPIIGHIQFAGVPDRAEPTEGEVNYRYIFEAIESLSYQGFIGAEYKPKAPAEAGIAWLNWHK